MPRLLAFLSRTPRLLYALWLVVAMTQPTGAHACPVHDRAVLEAMAAHGMAMAMHHAEEDTPAQGHHSSGQCHCLGDCCTGIATPLPSAVATVPAPASVLAETPLDAPSERSFDSPERLLPPATAPPASLVG